MTRSNVSDSQIHRAELEIAGLSTERAALLAERCAEHNQARALRGELALTPAQFIVDYRARSHAEGARRTAIAESVPLTTRATARTGPVIDRAAIFARLNAPAPSRAEGDSSESSSDQPPIDPGTDGETLAAQIYQRLNARHGKSRQPIEQDA